MINDLNKIGIASNPINKEIKLPLKNHKLKDLSSNRVLAIIPLFRIVLSLVNELKHLPHEELLILLQSHHYNVHKDN
ncbi:hypothetical protein VNI00_019461, partial [Paramarasmius palmivorus]